ncbi:hypothetical protein C5167_009086 [Papaver somniferum]|uniref:Uncharacterized protein n=1 Tax=Papaver somniferum TaxID=3469 RepID=A0A4Y7K034_PAPSO|nr:hypothetical protein C5167_009086 [Papaver somniferum]
MRCFAPAGAVSSSAAAIFYFSPNNNILISRKKKNCGFVAKLKPLFVDPYAGCFLTDYDVQRDIEQYSSSASHY